MTGSSGFQNLNLPQLISMVDSILIQYNDVLQRITPTQITVGGC